MLLVKAHETTLTAGKEFFAGSDAALRCEVHGVKSIAKTVPLPGAAVTIRLKGQDGKTISVYEGKVGDDGVANIQFKVPEKCRPARTSWKSPRNRRSARRSWSRT